MLSLRDDLFEGRVGNEIRFFDGKCQGLFRIKENADSISVNVKSKGLPDASIVIKCQKPLYKQVEPCQTGYVYGWRISKLYPGTMDDLRIMTEHQTERWKPVDTLGSPAVLAGARSRKNKPGLYPDDVPLNYGYYTKTRIPNLPKKEGQILALCFEGIDGKANIYITDGEKTDIGHQNGDSPWLGHYRPELMIPCGEFRGGDIVEIWVMMHEVGAVHGIGWPVHWLYTTQEEIDNANSKRFEEWNYYKSL